MRTHFCGKLNKDNITEFVKLCAWVNRRRDHGGIIFLDIRDKFGIVQVVVNPEHKKTFAIAEGIRAEYVLRVSGSVIARDKAMINNKLASGEVEVIASKIEILNTAKPIPFQINATDTSEEVRLKYRYLDLRSTSMQYNLRLRAKITNFINEFMYANDFINVETPFLTKATPEGARDYLVPSRTQRGKFFALPQSPQLFKQLLMVASIERYYQIVKCFRDEDLRMDRQPEFTQLDVEASFVNEDDIMLLMERMIRELFKKVINVDLVDKFPKISYTNAISLYGVDNPDMRIPLQMIDVSELMQKVDFKVFSKPANDSGSRVVALKVPGGATISRKSIDEYIKYVGIYGAKGLAYIKINKDGCSSIILKFLTTEIITKVIELTNAKIGDIIFFGADKNKIVNEALGHLRVQIGKDLGLLKSQWAPVWVTDFPMFTTNDDGSLDAMHHPFTAPKPNVDAKTLEKTATTALSRAYDLVINGLEIGGGSIRIHTAKMQKTVLKLLNINSAEAQNKFGFLLDALEYGCPPHGGIAFGLDRLVMIISGASSIREVIAFPKTQAATCLLTDAPAKASKEVLKELKININQI